MGTRRTPHANRIQILRDLDPACALGFAVSHLSRSSVFGAQSFSDVSLSLIGMINRQHYLFATDGGRCTGFLGWALTTKEKAEQWLAGSDLTHRDCCTGNVIIIIAWSSDCDETRQALLNTFRSIGQGNELVYFRRIYADGRARFGRLTVNRFVSGHASVAS